MVMDNRIFVELVLNERVFDNVLVGEQMVSSSQSDLRRWLKRYREQLLDEMLPDEIVLGTVEQSQWEQMRWPAITIQLSSQQSQPNISFMYRRLHQQS